MENANFVKGEVVYALPRECFLRQVELPVGSTVRDAILKSSILSKVPYLDIEDLKVGIFSKVVELATRLATGDRVEVYRPLMVSPADARRLRAERNNKVINQKV